jgi:hypothetical protein
MHGLLPAPGLRGLYSASHRKKRAIREACGIERKSLNYQRIIGPARRSCGSRRRDASDISERLRNVGDQCVCAIPSLFMRDSRVVGLTSSSMAAPLVPRIRQPQRSSVRRM